MTLCDKCDHLIPRYKIEYIVTLPNGFTKRLCGYCKEKFEKVDWNMGVGK